MNYNYALYESDTHQFANKVANCPLCRGVIRHGDVLREGTQDLIIQVRDKSNAKVYSYFYKSITCPYALAQSFKDVKGFDKGRCKYFSRSRFNGLMDSLSLNETFYSAFFDYGERG